MNYDNTCPAYQMPPVLSSLHLSPSLGVVISYSLPSRRNVADTWQTAQKRFVCLLISAELLETLKIACCLEKHYCLYAHSSFVALARC